MCYHILNVLNQSMSWRLLGIASSLVGFSCYARSSSFERLFGDWALLNGTLYVAFSITIISLVSFLPRMQVDSRRFITKAHGSLIFLVLASLYSHYYEEKAEGKPDVLTIISSAAFAIMSLCLSKQMRLGFERDLFYFFLGLLALQLMNIHVLLIFLAAVICYPLVMLRSYLEFQDKIDDRGLIIYTREGIENGASPRGQNHQQESGIRDSHSGLDPMLVWHLLGAQQPFDRYRPHTSRWDPRTRLAPASRESQSVVSIGTAATPNEAVNSETQATRTSNDTQQEGEIGSTRSREDQQQESGIRDSRRGQDQRDIDVDVAATQKEAVDGQTSSTTDVGEEGDSEEKRDSVGGLQQFSRTGSSRNIGLHRRPSSGAQSSSSDDDAETENEGVDEEGSKPHEE